MSSVRPSSKASVRLVVIVAVLLLVAGLSFAGTWSQVAGFLARVTGYSSAETVRYTESEPAPMFTAGTCDTAGPIEVEGSILGTTPTAYATLGAAFAAINAGTHTGVITIDVCGDTSEGTATALLSASGIGSSSYTSITMSPAGGAARTISGATTAGSPMIDFSGADNVTIDGLNTGGNSLTIQNTTASATSGTSTIRFIGGATNNTITNSNIQGSGSMSVATNGATIFFSTDAVSGNGNDNNTISNNNIGPAGSNLPTKAILCNGSTTSTAIGNSGNSVNNNNIFDFFGAAVTSSGIATNGGCNSWSITNNRLYQTATRTWTTGASHVGIDIRPATSTSGAQGFTITGNTIGYASNTQTGTYTLTGAGTGAKFIGILFNGIVSGTTSNVNNNTIAAVSMTGVTSSGTTTSSPFTAILLQEGNLISNGNTIGSQSATGSLTFSTTTTSSTDIYGIFNFTSNAWTSNNNTVGGISVTNLGASGTFQLAGIRAFTGSTVAWSATSNTVGGTVANSIQLNATGTASQVMGMYTSNAPASLTSNTVRNLTSNIGTGTTTGASVIGINITTSTPNHTLSQNTVSNLTNTNPTAASVVTGIQFTGSSANVVERNLIYGVTSATTSASAEINGIRVAGGTTTYRNNMIALGAGVTNAIGAAASNSGTTGINGINEALGTDNFYHNSVYIGGTATSGSGTSYAFNGTQTTNTRAFRDNIFFNARTNSGATGKHYAIKINGTTVNPSGLTINNNVYFANGSGGVFGFFNSADVANLAAWKTAVGQDASSFEFDPQFNDPTNATPDLHLHPTNPTPAEGNGTDVGVSNDFDGETRASLTPVDIGADAGNFVSSGDLTPPAITYSSLLNTSSTTDRELIVTITDFGSGVPTSGIGLPVIYYRKNADPYASTQCTYVSGNNYSCYIVATAVGGVTAGDTVRYYVAAQDASGNVSVNPSAGAGGLLSDPPQAATPPTTPSQYLIVGAINGDLNVGAGETYTSLTNTGGVFEAINASEVTGDVTINVTSDLSGETGTVALNEYASPYTVLIKPSGAPRTITSTTGATALITLNGADRVTIDGSLSSGTDRSLTLVNGNTSTSGTTVVALFSAGIGAGAVNNTIKNTIIQNGTKFETSTSSFNFCIYAGSGVSATSADNDNLTIQNNLIQRCQYGIQAVGFAGGALDNLIIQDNTLGGSVTADYIGRNGIVVGNATASSITRNTVRNHLYTAAADGFGILLSTGFVNSSVTRNTVNNLEASNSGGYGMTGIGISTATAASNLTVANNFVYDIRGTSWTTGVLADTVAGIRVSGTNTGGINIWNNSVNLFGNYAGASGSATISAAFMVHATTPTALDVRNNIFVNTFDNTAGSGDKSYSIYTTSANTMFSPIDYNDYLVSATSPGVLGAINSTDATTFASLQTATGGDANSKNVDPLFTSSTDLHMQATSTLIDAGATIASVTNDFDGDARPLGAGYEIGADEFVPPSPGTLQFSATATSLAEADGPVTLNVTRTNGSDNAVTVEFATGGGTATEGACLPGVDYNQATGLLSFAAGETEKTITVTICNDAVYEANQTFDVTLSNPTGGAVLGTNTTSTVTITNDDSAPTVTINDISQAEGNSGATNFQTTVTVSGPSEVGASFIFQTSDGTATAPTDYTAFPASQVNIAADVNRTSATQNGFFVPVNGDTTSEPDETFFLDGSTCTDCTFADNQGVATIQNDDGVDYTVMTTGNAIVVTDNSGNGDIVEIAETGVSQIRFTAAGRTFQVDGGSVLAGDSGDLSLVGVTAITFNGQGGNDTINVGTFVTTLPSLTLNGGTGDDTVNLSGSITFASNANLDVDHQNDDATPGTDNIIVAGNLQLSGTGAATFKASRSIAFNTGAQVTVVDGNLTVEANQQATSTAGAFSGVLITDALLTTNGSGDISVKGKGGVNASNGLRGVVVNASNVVLRSTSATAGAGSITIEGTGGAGLGSNRGIDLFGLNANDLVTSVTGDISITGTGGAGTASGNMGVFISSGKVRSTGAAKIDITGTGGTGVSSNSGVRVFNFGGEVSSTGGDITITGFGGPTSTGTSNHGVSVSLGGIVVATGGAKITIDGTAGGGAGFSTGTIVSGFDSVVTTAFSKVSSDSGDILITGDGGPSPASGVPGANIGININSGASVVGTGVANVTINGTGGACTDAAANDCYGVDFESADVAGTTVSTQAGNLSITGTAISPNGQRQNGIRFEDSVGAQPYTITTGTGSLTLTATAGNSDPSSAAIEFADDTTMTLGGATNTFVADTISINNSQVAINAGANALTIRQKSNGRQIDLGGADSATVLGLSDAELDLITAGTLNIGDVNSGTMIVSSAISRTASTALNLTSGGDIDIQGGSLDSGGGNIVVDAFADTLATNSGVDVTTGAASSFKVASGRTLRLNIGAAVPDTGYNQLNVAGQVDVTNVALSLNATATPTGGEVYTIVNNDGTDAVIGTFTGLSEGATISNFLGSGLPATISYVGGTGNDVVLTVASAPTIQFSSSTATVGEGDGSVTLNVTRTGYTGAAASVEFATSNGTATGGPSCVAGVDFVNTSGTLNFAIGETSKNFDVTICDDAIAEASETFSATLSLVSGATLGNPTTATVTITDNDGDTTLPTVSYTPLTNVATVQDRVFSVTATDNVGVTAVTVVWRNNGGGAGFLTNPCSFSSGTAQNGTWTCTILSSFGQTSPGTVSYFVSADDAASNEATSPAGANVGGGTWNMYTIGTGGTINVSIINTFENVVLGDGFTLLGNANVTGNLTLNGILNTDANKLTFGCNATVTGQNETNYVFGSIEKQFCSLQTFVFPVGGPTLPPLAPEGIPAGNYSPLTVNVTGGTVGSSLTVSVTDGFLADTDNTNSLSRFWDITEAGNVTADLTFQYRPEDVNGNPANYLVLKRESGSTATYPPGTIDALNYRFRANGISDFSSWSAGVLSPTAANAAVEGRIRTAGGLGIRNATVVISGGGLDAPRTVQTGSFGYFRFDGLPVGETYVISVVSPRYVFANPTRLVTLDDNVIGFDFYAEP